MAQRSGNIIIATILIVAVISGVVYWKTQQPPAANGPAGVPPTVISATKVTSEQWQPMLSSVGSLVATNGIQVSTEVNGIVKEIVFESGQPVEKDQVLVKLDVNVDMAAQEALRAERKLAEVQFNRARDLLKKKVTSKSEYDEAQARFEAATARVHQQQAIIDRKIIRAPFSGLAGIRQVDLGQYVEAGAPIVDLQSVDPIFADYALPERYINQISTGQTIKIRVDAMPEREFIGELSAVNSGIDTGTRTLKVRATLPNTDHALRPGMFAEIKTVTGDARPTLTLPRTTISFNTYGNVVYVISSNDKGESIVTRTAIETGESREGRIAVMGIAEGTQVVRTGLVKLRDGMHVKIDNKVELNDAEIRSE